MIKLKRCIVTPIAIVGCQLLGACGGSSGSAAETSGEATLDVKRLPIGDGKVSSTPRVGYVFACSIPTASAASRSVP